MKKTTEAFLWTIVVILLVIAIAYIILALSGKDVIDWIPVTSSISAAILSTYLNVKSML